MLQKLRQRAGLTQQQLAERSGVSIDAIRGFEQGRFRMRLDKATALAKALAPLLGEDISKLLINLADAAEVTA